MRVLSLAPLAQPQRTSPFSEFRGGRLLLQSNFNYRLQWRRGRGKTRRNAFLEFQYHWNVVLMDARGKCGCGHPILHKIHRFAKRRILLQDMVLRLKTLRWKLKSRRRFFPILIIYIPTVIFSKSNFVYIICLMFFCWIRNFFYCNFSTLTPSSDVTHCYKISIHVQKLNSKKFKIVLKSNDFWEFLAWKFKFTIL